MAARPLPPPRARFHLERIREVWARVDAENAGSLTLANVKRSLDDQDVDWSTCGLETAKINRAVFHGVEMDPERVVDFDAFWKLVVDNGRPDGGVDPVLETHYYMEKHRVGPVFEAMTAALMVAKPDDPRAFLTAKLEALKASGTPVLGFTEQELVTLFNMSDVAGRGAISGAKASRALEVLTGRVPDEVAGAKEVSRETFIGVAKGQLDAFCS